QVVVVAVIPPSRDRYVRRQLVLDADGGLYVVHPLDARVEVRKARDTEPGRQLRQVDFAARLQVGTSELPLGDAIAVGIGPGDVGCRELQRVVALREARRTSLHVLADAEFHGSLLVAEDVVDQATARRDAVPGRHVDRPERSSRGETARGRRLHW